LAATEKLTLPLPLLFDPDVMLIQEALGTTVYGQVLPELPGSAVTLTIPVPPLPGTLV
jgi:hypothetical protein